MKNVIAPLLKVTAGTALVAGLVFSSACSKTRDTTASNSGSGTTSNSASNTADNANATPSATATTAPASTASGTMAASSTSGTGAAMAATESWDNLKGYSYDQRSDFAAKATEYANRLDARVSTAKGTAATKLTEARDELRTAATEVSRASADTWDATKDRVGAAWQKADMAIRSAAE